MPEPGYTNGEPPGPLVFVGGTVIVVILFLVLKSCIWGG
jgi:hypothetical protein